jgi:hypothetical protein
MLKAHVILRGGGGIEKWHRLSPGVGGSRKVQKLNTFFFLMVHKKGGQVRF